MSFSSKVVPPEFPKIHTGGVPSSETFSKELVEVPLTPTGLENQSTLSRTDSETDMNGNESETMKEARASKRKMIIGFFCAVTSYTILGLNPVFTRYLITVQKIPPLSINTLANIMVLFVYICFTLIRSAINVFRFHIFASRSVAPLNTLDKDTKMTPPSVSVRITVVKLLYSFIVSAFVTYRVLWLLALFAVSRSAVNIISTKYTKATYIQLVNLCSPFVVTVISIAARKYFEWQERSTNLDNLIPERTSELFANERINLKLFVAMVITMLGGMLIIISSLSLQGSTFWEFPTVTSIVQGFTFYDILGILLSIIAAILMSAYNVTLKIASNSVSLQEKSNADVYEMHQSTKNLDSNVNIRSIEKELLVNVDSELKRDSAKKKELLSQEQLLFFHLVVFSFGYSILCMIFREKWAIWLNLPPIAYLLFVIYAFSNYLIGNIVHIAAIKFFGATNTSSVMALSLVSTISFSWILLGEIIRNIYEVIGIIIVLTSITAYMLLKRQMVNRV
jgi:drug/metabolite transporter (DMT)-like permease